jgi:hypothetical protein
VRFDRIADWFTASAVVYEEDSVWPDARVFRGRDAVVRRFIDYLDLVHIRRVTPGEVLDAGDVVLAEAASSGLNLALESAPDRIQNLRLVISWIARRRDVLGGLPAG